ncbi:hypothetical protein DID73_01265 [Candidatus Marinamargulisbacteria bacterium SCGC AG-343-K17]|nr:hypothetical protein DID73_01265 [Candidatus Marinamargulisbacteria bacterium SCGC AG-343-K17]
MTSLCESMKHMFSRAVCLRSNYKPVEGAPETDLEIGANPETVKKQHSDLDLVETPPLQIVSFGCFTFSGGVTSCKAGASRCVRRSADCSAYYFKKPLLYYVAAEAGLAFCGTSIYAAVMRSFQGVQPALTEFESLWDDLYGFYEKVVSFGLNVQDSLGVSIDDLKQSFHTIQSTLVDGFSDSDEMKTRLIKLKGLITELLDYDTGWSRREDIRAELPGLIKKLNVNSDKIASVLNNISTSLGGQKEVIHRLSVVKGNVTRFVADGQHFVPELKKIWELKPYYEAAKNAIKFREDISDDAGWGISSMFSLFLLSKIHQNLQENNRLVNHLKTASVIGTLPEGFQVESEALDSLRTTSDLWYVVPFLTLAITLYLDNLLKSYMQDYNAGILDSNNATMFSPETIDASAKQFASTVFPVLAGVIPLVTNQLLNYLPITTNLKHTKHVIGRLNTGEQVDQFINS